ncbi:hypothetical protein ADK41_24970 [Streptomyces caelestis]|uniref:Uncharacterized protein n=1 Tax=Streptomyces caelestis TaxID=36816 RepID=A0A0M9X7A2_9ACTN|nr:hypothetical protein ADK41_24970 [Streptomyces caelestis]KOV26484.1 hypothetical protein ADK58_14410 [Streptomyces sp. XY152]
MVIRPEETTSRGGPGVRLPRHARPPGFTAGGASCRAGTWYRPETGTAAPRTWEKAERSFAVL